MKHMSNSIDQYFLSAIHQLSPYGNKKLMTAVLNACRSVLMEKKIATGGGDGLVKLWDTIGAAETKTASLGRGSISCLAINQSS